MNNLVDVICELLGSPLVLSEVRVAHHSSVLCFFLLFFCVFVVACFGSVCVMPNATIISGFPIIDCRFRFL